MPLLRNWIAALSFWALLICALLACDRDYADLRLENRSEQLIVNATVTLCKQDAYFENLSPNKSVNMKYVVHGDCSYAVVLTFENGKILQEMQIGYVTAGFNYKDKMQVTDNGIQLSSSVENN
jgi:hypothetical protein